MSMTRCTHLALEDTYLKRIEMEAGRPSESSLIFFLSSRVEELKNAVVQVGALAPLYYLDTVALLLLLCAGNQSRI